MITHTGSKNGYFFGAGNINGKRVELIGYKNYHELLAAWRRFVEAVS